MLKCNNRDQIAYAIGLHGWKTFEPPMPELFYRLAQQLDGALLDVGANTGFYCLVGAAARHDMKILAFEPDPNVLPILRGNLKINAVDRYAHVFPMALSDSRGDAELHIPTPEHGLIETSSSLESDFRTAHSAVIQVPTNTVDHIIEIERPGKVAIIKIDVEGHEAAVLRGATGTVNSHRPVLFVEVLARADFRSFSQFIYEFGYKDMRLQPNGATKARDEVSFDPDAWNHILVPTEKIALVGRCWAMT